MKSILAILILALGMGVRGAPAATNASAVATNAPARTNIPEKPFAKLRDPFWPVNWQPTDFGPAEGKPQVGPSVAIKWTEAQKLLQVTALSRTPKGRHIAIVKDVGVVEEGDVISIHYGQSVYKWTVRAITAAGIETEKLGVYPLAP